MSRFSPRRRRLASDNGRRTRNLGDRNTRGRPRLPVAAARGCCEDDQATGLVFVTTTTTTTTTGPAGFVLFFVLIIFVVVFVLVEIVVIQILIVEIVVEVLVVEVIVIELVVEILVVEVVVEILVVLVVVVFLLLFVVRFILVVAREGSRRHGREGAGQQALRGVLFRLQPGGNQGCAAEHQGILDQKATGLRGRVLRALVLSAETF
jgi:hypothetical protein